MIKNVLLKIVVALLLALIIVFFLDKSFFKYKATTAHSEMNGRAVYDLDNDGYSEFCMKTNIKDEGVYFEYWSKNFLKKLWRDTLVYQQQPVLVTDIDKDGVLEDYFVTISDSATFLNWNIFESNETDSIPKLKHTRKKIFTSGIKNNTRVKSYYTEDLNNDSYNEIIFIVENGIERREIVVYDVMNDSVTFSQLSTMFITDLNFQDLDNDGYLDILFSSYANGNFSNEILTSYGEKTNSNTSFYTDLNSYLGVLDHNLNLQFINQTEGFTTMYNPVIISENEESWILTIESQMSDSLQIPSLAKYDNEGNELLRKKMPFKVASNVFGKNKGDLIIKSTISGEQIVYLNGLCDSIIEIDANLNFVNYFYREGVNKDSRLRRFDLNGDGLEEIIINVEAGFLIYQDGFKDELFVPSKSSKKFRVFELAENEKHFGVYFKLGSHQGFYLNYEKNQYYYWKYLLYLGVFICLYGVIHGIQKYGALQLEKDKKQLEIIVNERTAELSVKNKDLNKVLSEVEKQRHILEEKNQEIMDSIQYAQRIQKAILPPRKLVKEYLQKSFILYKPKDIVAGDFYWMEHRDGKVLFAAADCTGHGVPGAMVSVVCNNGLNRSVREYNLTDPGEILNKTRKIVIEEFEKSEEDVKDGMDIALCSLEGNTLKFAGAYNPLWIIRNGEIIETKADKQPIGQFDNPQPYTTHTFELQKNDTFYVFSDGLVDQFGGEKGKKFKPKAFRELLLSIQDKDLEAQKQIIDDVFEDWKNDIEQVDDVCVIGVRI